MINDIFIDPSDDKYIQLTLRFSHSLLKYGPFCQGFMSWIASSLANMLNSMLIAKIHIQNELLFQKHVIDRYCLLFGLFLFPNMKNRIRQMPNKQNLLLNGLYYRSIYIYHINLYGCNHWNNIFLTTSAYMKTYRPAFKWNWIIPEGASYGTKQEDHMNF